MKKHKVKIPKGYEYEREIDMGHINQNKPKESKVIGVVLRPIKKELPKTWEKLKKVSGFYINSESEGVDHAASTLPGNRNIWPTGELAEAALALSQLCQLRDHYNDGWEPDYKNSSQIKYYIGNEGDKISTGQLSYTSRVLAFKTQELRDRFYQYFKELIETAKPLL